MARLKEEQVRFIVHRLAMFDTPQQVADAVKDEFGVAITRQGVQFYDPTVGEQPGKKWIAIFKAVREKFLDSQADIPIAQKSVRLRRLERMAVAAESRKNYVLAAQLHEQAAKECGDFYTNTRKLAHSGGIGGGVLAVPVPVSDEQWGAAAIAQQTALATKPALAAAGSES